MSRGATWAIVPVKSLADSKQRLAGVLPLEARRRLMLVMLEDVLGTLRQVEALDVVLVVTPDPLVQEVAERLGARILREDRAAGHSAAAAAGFAAARSGGAVRALTLPADAPLVTPDEVRALLAARPPSPRMRGEGRGEGQPKAPPLFASARRPNPLPTDGWGEGTRPCVTLVPARDGDGTNALLVAPPDAFAPAFGPGSFARHLALAAERGIACRALSLPGLSLDIDEPDDLRRLIQLKQADRRYDFLQPYTDRHAASVMSPSNRGLKDALAAADSGHPLSHDQALALAQCDDLPRLTAIAERLCLAAHGHAVSFSKKVFIPLTRLCRDVCHYCTFARAPNTREPHYLSPDAVIAIARAGQAAGCKEALFTLGDQPELRYATARNALAALGFDSTLAYLEASAALVLRETGLLPHLNPGVMDETWLARLRRVSVSQGIMLETASERLSERGGPHFGSPDKTPAVRLATLDAAGRAGVPFTTGILIGIGETRVERIEALLAIRDSHARHGHIQEVIIQNFRAKPGTRMAAAAEPSLDDHAWTIAVARLILGPAMNIQAPPNLQPAGLAQLIRAGINDWGGVSPVTPDHVNPEAPWPHLLDLERATQAAGRTLTERLAVYPEFCSSPSPRSRGEGRGEGRPQARTQLVSAPHPSPLPTEARVEGMRTWLDAALHTPVLRQTDGMGLAREDTWSPGTGEPLPAAQVARIRQDAAPSPAIARILDGIAGGETPTEPALVPLFEARGRDFSAVCRAADRLRARRNGDVVTYVVNRNINYTNICTYGCKFCAFSKGRHNLGHREKPYDLDLDEIARRTGEAWGRGATEVCLQGGIRPGYTGETYRSIVEAVKSAAADVHVHAFSPLEVWHGAETLGLALPDYLTMLKAAGLASLPGTAAEILDDEVRAVLCPDKISTAQWLEVMEAAHGVGLRSTATIMFGHVDGYRHWARHLLRVRALQEKTGGFTEFVPLPFVHMEAPIYLKGQSRKGPTFREAVLMHAIARLALDPVIPNVQASWVKMGPDGAALCLEAGCNDMGGVLMDESITRAAGAVHGQRLGAADMDRLIRGAGRIPRQRTTLYAQAPAARFETARPAELSVPHRPPAAAE